MRDKTDVSARTQGLRGQTARCVRSDLESRGVGLEFARPVAERLGAIASDLTRREYHAILDGVVAAYRVHDSVGGALPEEADVIHEIQGLMTGFIGELRKLEEGLQILSAYVTRMGKTAARETPSTLH